MEQGYLKQFNFVRENFAIPLLESQTTIEQDRRYQFHSSLFRNYLLLSSFHLEFHQKLEAIREPGTFLFPNEIADIILQHVKLLEEPYIRYATNHVFAIHNFKMECNKNVAFANFVTEQQNINKDFRLPLTNYLLVPTQKLGKYRLLLTTLLKYLEDQEECHILLEIDQLLNSILHKMNEATRDAEAEQRLYDIKLGLRVANRRTTSTTFKFPHHLLSENATLLLEASLTYWTKLSIATSTCHIFLFSDKFFITRTKILDSGMTEYTLIERAIPIAMLQFSPKSRSRILTQQGTFLSSLRHQLGSTSNYPSHIPSPTSLSDDASSTYSTVRTISGLRIRHRFRRMKNSIKRHSSVSVGPSKHLYGKKGLDKLQQQQDMVPQRMASPHVVRSKHFQIYHKAYPDLSYHFECNTAEDRQQWRSMIKSVLATPNNGPFDLRGICSVPNGSNLPKVNGRYPTGCGTIWCTLPFSEFFFSVFFWRVIIQ